MTTNTNPSAESGISEATVQAIVQALTGLRYGQVTVMVQDGRVMQIDRTDRFRLPPAEVPAPTESRIPTTRAD